MPPQKTRDQKHKRVRLAKEAANPATPPHRLNYLATHHPRLIPTLASNPALSENTIRNLVTGASEDVKRSFIYNPATPSNVLSEFTRDLEVADSAHRQILARVFADYLPVSLMTPEQRRHAAENHETDQQILLVLALHQTEVRVRVASNPALSTGNMLWMTSDTNKKVRRGLANNPGASVELLLKLSLDPAVIVREGVAMRKDLDDYLKARLLLDPSKCVRSAAAGQPGFTEIPPVGPPGSRAAA